MRSMGLPGNIGNKARNFFMNGFAAGLNGKPYKSINQSKACVKAHKDGWEKGNECRLERRES